MHILIELNIAITWNYRQDTCICWQLSYDACNSLFNTDVTKECNTSNSDF